MGTYWFLALAGPTPAPFPGPDVAAGVRGLVGVAVVLGLVALFAWMLRRGVFGPIGRKGPSAVRVETAVPLGDRRALIVVAVEGRRLLLGLTPGQVSFVTELRGGDAGFTGALDRAVDQPAKGAL